MKILVHDYAGHPFQVQLSRALAKEGHSVTHAYFAGDFGPKGNMVREKYDSERLTFTGVNPVGEYSKTNLIKRRFADIAYGKHVADIVHSENFDLILSGNTPTEAQERILRMAVKVGSPFIFWCQDFYSVAVNHLLSKKLPLIGSLVGLWYTRLERSQMHRADHIVHITDSFLQQTDAWNISRQKITVIPNWGALEDIPQRERVNSWSLEHLEGAGQRCLYSGTLALKHNPELLLAASRALTNEEQLIVVASGVGVDHLRRKKLQHPTMQILPLQPFEQFSDVLASANVLLAVIEADAGKFSVPSKILSYLCAGRPIVLAAPKDNLAAQLVSNIGAGIVVEPDDISGFCAAIRHYLNDANDAARAGDLGRKYAESNFDIDQVVARFEEVFDRVSDLGL